MAAGTPNFLVFDFACPLLLTDKNRIRAIPTLHGAGTVRIKSGNKN